MSAGFDAASDRISYSGAMPDPVDGITITAWVYVSADVDGPATFFRLWNAARSTVATVAINSGGTDNPGYFTGGGSAFVPAVLSLNTWYRIAITCSGTAGKFYLAEGADGPTQVGSGTVAGASSPAGITFGGRDDLDSSESFVGWIAYPRVFPSEFGQAGIEAEWASTEPVASGEWSDWPLETASDLTDHSGNGRDLVAGATAVTTEDGPPIAAVVTGALAGTAPAATTAMFGNVTAGGAIAGSAPAATGDVAGTATVAGVVAADAPPMTAAVAGDVTAGGVLDATAPSATASLAGAVRGTAVLAGTSPAAAADIWGDVRVVGEMTASPQAAVAAFVGDVSGGDVDGVLDAKAPVPVAAFAGSVRVAAVLAAVAPAPVGRLVEQPPGEIRPVLRGTPGARPAARPAAVSRPVDRAAATMGAA